MDFLISNLSSIGLFIDIIGAVILWKYGLPATIDHKEFDAVMEHCLVVGKNSDYEETVSNSEVKMAKVKGWSRWGLGLLLFGFLLQGIGNLVSSVDSDTSRANLEKAHAEIITITQDVSSISESTIANKDEIASINQKIQKLASKQELLHLVGEQDKLLEEIKELSTKHNRSETKNMQNAEAVAELESRILEMRNHLTKYHSK
ncbi:hypothetical protein M2G43_20470 [Vibrio vulnificus]|nr:hypothetical protein [Vibrio vulnificus]